MRTTAYYFIPIPINVHIYSTDKTPHNDPSRDYDGKVTPEEVAAAASYLKDTLGREGVQELISSLSKDAG